MTGEPDTQPGPLSLAVAYATIGRAAAERHAEGEAILAYEHALPLAEAAVARRRGDLAAALRLYRTAADLAAQHVPVPVGAV